MASEPQQISGLNARGKYCEVLYKGHSLYGELRVIEEGGRFRYMVVNGSDQGGLDLLDGSSAYRYDAAMIGLGVSLCAQPAECADYRPGCRDYGDKADAGEGIDVVVVEIDPEVVRLAREYFGFQGQAVAADGRRYLQRNDRKWDLIFVDAYLGSSPPWQLYTREAFEAVSRQVETGGCRHCQFHRQSPGPGAITCTRGGGHHGPRGVSRRGCLP